MCSLHFASYKEDVPAFSLCSTAYPCQGLSLLDQQIYDNAAQVGKAQIQRCQAQVVHKYICLDRKF